MHRIMTSPTHSRTYFYSHSYPKISFYFLVPFLFLLLLVAFPHSSNELHAQTFGHGVSKEQPAFDSTHFHGLEYRNIGPFRGGRSVAVAGHDDQPLTYYMGATGGGVYKTTDGGNTWLNISDGYFKTGSVGALTVAPSDPNVIYAGMGETCIRGNMSAGDGVYRSTDEGKTWQHIGLGDTQFIGEIAVHPQNPDIAWVAALGHTFGTNGNEQRGVFKTTDGGKTWNKVLYRNRHTGAVDVEIDPNNPRVLYASLWEAYRSPWKMSSGGEGSGLFKSTDGGETWQKLSSRPGMPKGVTGKIGVAVSPVNSNRVWAIIENKNGGVFRSDDAGSTWTRINSDRSLRQRAWYYTHIYADPHDEETVYVLNVGFYRSDDGGKSFNRYGTPHGDHHDLWIDPDNPKRMVVADDGGAQVSFNRGESWTSYYKYATAQFYHVTTDNQFPYRVYGAQQDNSTVGIKNRTAGSDIERTDWHPVAGGESGYIAPDPEDPDQTYGGSYGGYFTKHNSTTKHSDRIDVWPDNPMGYGAEPLKYRFQWTFPIHISPHDPDVLYTAAQYLFRSSDEGMSWERISGDLTRNDPSRQQKSGGPITYDDTSVEYYNTIFAFAESPVKKGVLWTGADDGLVHISRDNGKTWTEVTPKNMPESMISIIEPSNFDQGTAYLAVNRYKFDDFTPMIYKTNNYGKSWEMITDGINPMDFVRVVREDPHRQGLLYAGTETGVYVSFDDGEQWQPLQLNLPNVPITDLAVQEREKDLVVATQGRSFWILDDLGVLHQLSDEVQASEQYLYQPEPTYLFGRYYEVPDGRTVGQNPHSGAVVHYYLQDSTDAEVKLEFYDDRGELIRSFSNKEDLDGNKVEPSDTFYEEPERQQQSDVLTSHAGLNQFAWNMRYPGAEDLEGTQILWAGSTRGPKAVPGRYTVTLMVDDEAIAEQTLEIKKDPRLDASQQDLEEQFELIRDVVAKLDETHKAINTIRETREQINSVLGKQSDDEDHTAKEAAKPVLDSLAAIEAKLVQVKAEAFQDVLNYPIKLNNKLAALASTVATGYNRPTDQEYAVFDDLSAKVDAQLDKLEPILQGQLQTLMKEIETPAVKIEYEE